MRNSKRCHSRLLVLHLRRNDILGVVLKPFQTWICHEKNGWKYPCLPRYVLEKVASVKLTVLIGQDNQTLMVNIEVVEPDPLDLIIKKTKLGWIVHGGDNGGSTQEAIVHICCC
jgi:hypothetical protein